MEPSTTIVILSLPFGFFFVFILVLCWFPDELKEFYKEIKEVLAKKVIIKNNSQVAKK